MNEPLPRICDYLAKPRLIPLRKLVELTREYYTWSSVSDNSHSQYHRWYYCLAGECERRGLDLDRVLRK